MNVEYKGVMYEYVPADRPGYCFGCGLYQGIGEKQIHTCRDCDAINSKLGVACVRDVSIFKEVQSNDSL